MRTCIPLALVIALAACGSSGGNITVHGKMVDRYGTGTPGATIVLGGRSTTTDSNGSFTFSDVSPPYDLAQVILDEVPTQFAIVYSGLTRADPILPDRRRTTTFASAWVTGNLTGPDPVGGPDRWTAVAWGSPGVTAQSAAGPDPYTLEVDWTGPGSIAGTVHALQWLGPTEFPVTYTMYGEAHGTLDAGSHAALDIVLAAVQTASVSGTVAIADAGYTASQMSMDVLFEDGATISVGGPSFADGAFSFPVPALSGARANLAFSLGNGTVATSTTLQGVAPGAAGLAVPFWTPPSLLSPADQTTGVDTRTEFSWTPIDQGLAIFVAVANPMQVLVITGRTSAHLPDLRAYGVSIPTATSGVWAVYGFGPWSSVDALAAVGTLTAPGPTAFQTHSGSRHFTLP